MNVSTDPGKYFIDSVDFVYYQYYCHINPLLLFDVLIKLKISLLLKICSQQQKSTRDTLLASQQRNKQNKALYDATEPHHL